MGAPSEKQVKFAQKVSDSTGNDIPGEAFENSHTLSLWINENIKELPVDEEGKAIFKPTINQVRLAERIAEGNGTQLPAECYKNAKAMSQWIDEHIGDMKSRPTEKMAATVKKICEKYPETEDPSEALESFEACKEWLDRNFPEDWKTAGGGQRRGGAKSRKGRF